MSYFFHCIRNAIDGVKTGAGGKGNGNGSSEANGGSGVNDSFNKHYNKELKVSEDEIPMVLLELNESALIYI